MPQAEYDIFTIAAGFPPGLNTAGKPTDIEVDETPDGYGYDLSKDDVIAKGTIPSGTARVAKTITISTVPYLWHYNRLWNITALTASTASNFLYYGAPLYDHVYMPQRNGIIPFDEDTETIAGIIPFSGDSLAVLKSSGGYVLSNLTDTRAFFSRTPLMQELTVAAIANAVELDSLVYVSNANGLVGLQGLQTAELTRKVRDDLTNFSSVALMADYVKKRIIGGATFVYEPATQKIFRYVTTSFRYTTRQFHLPDWRPFSVDRVLFVIQHADEEDGDLTYQVKFEDEDWGDETLLPIQYQQEKFTVIDETLSQDRSVRKFQLRVTDLASNIYIKQVRLDRQAFKEDDYVT